MHWQVGGVTQKTDNITLIIVFEFCWVWYSNCFDVKGEHIVWVTAIYLVIQLINNTL